MPTLISNLQVVISQIRTQIMKYLYRIRSHVRYHACQGTRPPQGMASRHDLRRAARRSGSQTCRQNQPRFRQASWKTARKTAGEATRKTTRKHIRKVAG